MPFQGNKEKISQQLSGNDIAMWRFENFHVGIYLTPQHLKTEISRNGLVRNEYLCVACSLRREPPV